MQLNAQKGQIPPELEAGMTTAIPAGAPKLPIDARTLANLDFGLFKTLCKMGTSKERICSAMCLSDEEYDYIRTLL